MTPLIEVSGLKKHFPIRKGILRRTIGQVHAVDGISFSIGEGETLALVGESGCGKSTVGRAVLRLIEPTAGSVMVNGREITGLGKQEMRPLRRQMQIVFQDPYASLNPHLSAGAIVSEPLTNFNIAAGAELQQRIAWLFQRVGLHADAMRKYPHEFSGGQRQRLGIARALAVNPSLIVADEPISALDVSVQAQVLNLLIDLQDEFGLAYLFISHDLAVVEHIGHRVAVMYLGRIVELAGNAELFGEPLHPYSEALLAAVPVPEPGLRRERLILQGDVPSPVTPPPGCHFHTRCPYAQARCRTEEPTLQEVKPAHWVACHLRPVGGPFERLRPTVGDAVPIASRT
jgi:oligopeptide transport system ATP-binding protein